MSWTNPPPSVVGIRDAILQCPTVQASILNGLTTPQQQARFHYPKADVRSDTMPAFVLRRIRSQYDRRDAFGALGQGTVIAHLYFTDVAVDDGTLESYADAIAAEICSLATADTQYVIRAEAGECVEPSPAMLAAAVAGQPDEQGVSFRVISLTMDWEG